LRQQRFGKVVQSLTKKKTNKKTATKKKQTGAKAKKAANKPKTKKTTTKKQNLLDMVKRVSLMSNRTTKQVVLSLNQNKITATAEDHETGGSAVDEIEAKHIGDSCTIGFNGTLLLEILRHQKTENIELLTNTPSNTK
jgi:DNA polymerase III sliding clamp (beta) subunit (PCNA family)